MTDPHTTEQLVRDLASARDRTLLLTDTKLPADEQETHGYRRFLERLGYSFSNVEVVRHAPLPVPDADLDAWAAQAARKAGSYEVRTLVNEVPPELAQRHRGDPLLAPRLAAQTHPQGWAIWEAVAGVELPPGRERPFAHVHFALDAALAGLGMLVVSWPLVAEAVADGRLVAPFGFRRAIAHGMWTHARTLAALQPRLGEAFEVSVDFSKPVLLPSTVRFTAGETENGYAARLTDRRGDKVFLTLIGSRH